MTNPFPINFNTNKRTPESQKLIDLYKVREYSFYDEGFIADIRKRNAESKIEDALI